MKKTTFKEMGGIYTRAGDYYLLALTLPAEKENRPIGVCRSTENTESRETSCYVKMNYGKKAMTVTVIVFFMR